MKFILYLSELIIPLLIFVVIATGIVKKRDVYNDFITGAKEGAGTAISILPTLMGLMMGVGMLRKSGFLDFISEKIGKLTEFFYFPGELIPIAVVKLFSSSAATGLLLDLYKEYGTDTYLGMAASVMLSSTETVFYTMSVYFMSVKITKSRWTLKGALISSFAGIVMSVFISSVIV